MDSLKINNCIVSLDRIVDHPVLRQIGEMADALSLETYVVGGFVRDLFLGRVAKDIDIVCVGDSIVLAQAVAQYKDVPVTFLNVLVPLCCNGMSGH